MSASSYQKPNAIIVFAPFVALALLGIPFVALALSAAQNVPGPITIAANSSLVDIASALLAFWSTGAFISFPSIVIAGLIAAACGGLFVYTHKLVELNGEGSDLGNVKIKKGSDVRKGFAGWTGTGIVERPGFVCGCGGKGQGSYFIAPWTQSPMGVLIGDTGTGKTRRIIIPNVHCDLGAGVSVLLTDRKGDLAGILAEGIEQAGIPLFIVDPSDPGISATYDPVDLVMDYAEAGENDAAVRAAEAVSATIIPEGKENKDPHWIKSARGIMTAAILYIAFADIDKKYKTLPNVISLVSDGVTGKGADPALPLKTLLRELPEEHPARKSATQLFTLEGREQGSVLSTLTVALRPFSTAAITRIASGNDANPKRLLDGQCAIFLRIGDETNPLNALISLFIEQLGEFAELYTKEGKRRENDVSVLLDEAGNLPPIPNLPTMYTTGRSQGLRVLSVWQETAQIERNYDKAGKEAILGNSALHIPLSPSSEEDKRFYSDMVGKTTRQTKSVSKGTTGARGSASTSLSQQVDHVIHPWDWRERDNKSTIVIRSRKGATPAEAGVFEVPLEDATQTPAKTYFSLGTEEDDLERVSSFRNERLAQNHEPKLYRWSPQWVTIKEEEELAAPLETYSDTAPVIDAVI